MISDVLSDTETKMGKAIEALERDLAGIRTGRASARLVDSIRVDYFGTPTPLSQLASISVPEARLLTIQPWDKSVVPAIEKAILKSDLGLNPSNQGNVIRLQIPELTEERRRELVKVVRKKAEDGKISIRNIRRSGLEKLRDMEKTKEISEDEEKRAEKQLQEITDKYIGNVDEVEKNKENDVMED
ncbi:MAG: ribosome recycling factor [Chloroflexi bacterium]|jgi:ribosome recycling factor|nr:ribosome recycling factor [Chloroflexota bacterium]